MNKINLKTKNMETLLKLTLFGSIFWGIAALVILLVVCFLSDLDENGFFATVALIVIGTLFYFFGKETWHLFISILTFVNLAIYFGAGLLHAFIRVYFHGRNEMKKVNEDRLNGRSYEHTIERDIKLDVFRWWFMWPISLIDWFVKDLIKDIYDWIYDKISKVFDFVLNLGIKSVKEIPKKEKQ
jgi:hypothetical protein